MSSLLISKHRNKSLFTTTIQCQYTGMKCTFNCRCCGHCCLNLIDAYNGCVSDADLQRWRELGRSDLLIWIKTLELGPGNRLHMAWVDPETGDDVERCPWLLDRLSQKGYMCGIEAIKPDHCRAYPEHQEHADATDCNGYRQEPVIRVQRTQICKRTSK